MLSFLIRRFRGALLAAAIASVISGSCSVFLVSQINVVLAAQTTAPLQGLKFALSAVAAMCAHMFSAMLFQNLRQRAGAELREYISGQVMQAPFRYLERVGSASVQSALSEHTASVTQFFVSVPALLTSGAIVVGCLIYLMVLSPRIFLVTLPFVALGAFGYHLAHLKAINYLRSGTAEQERLFEHFRSLTEGAKELRLNRAKRRFFSDSVLSRSIESVRRQRTVGMSLFVAASSWGNFLIYAFLGLVLFVIAGDIPDRARVLTGFALVMVYMVGPLQALLVSIPNANLVKVAAERIEALVRGMKSTELEVTAVSEGALRSIELQSIRHRYHDPQSNESFHVGPIDLRFAPGEVTFLVGGNGSGKTTLAKVLVGLYPPEAGAILLNDELIDDANRDRYRQQFSAVFSDFHLFDSLLEQRRPELDERGNRLLARLQLLHKVQLREGAFTTRSLSHGQRKRLALVVACLEDRPVLVFDEWAADQDPGFKNIFYREVLAELREEGKSVVVISHDDRYFDVADRIVRLENGLVV
ncbi:cyclic peptide export ABC transporter [Steroidobacter flavus]|uniref:Cyclic peptide export ABC transporter n=1 Tax=Steroidobacter flavus TaxID=1842136 RepID=A0ABV8T3C1_9GAMM